MGAVEKKSRRIRGAELVVTGGATMFVSSILGWMAPVALCVYGLYRWFLRKSYKDGIISVAVGILLVTLLRGPLNAFLWISMLAGGLLLGLGAVMMILPSRKSEDVEIKPE